MAGVSGNARTWWQKALMVVALLGETPLRRRGLVVGAALKRSGTNPRAVILDTLNSLDVVQHLTAVGAPYPPAIGQPTFR